MKLSDDPCERRFTLRVQPECADHPWHTRLENEGHATVEFSSLLVLARFLANLSVEEREDVQVTRGLR